MEGYNEFVLEMMDKIVVKGWVARDNHKKLWLCLRKPYYIEGFLMGKQILLQDPSFEDVKYGGDPAEVEMEIRRLCHDREYQDNG